MPPKLTAALTFFTVAMASLIAGLAPEAGPRVSLIVLSGILLLPAAGFALAHWWQPLRSAQRAVRASIAGGVTKRGKIKRVRKIGLPPDRVTDDGKWMCPYDYALNAPGAGSCKDCGAERRGSGRIMPPAKWDSERWYATTLKWRG